MTEFWAAIVLIFVVSRFFKLIEKRSAVPHNHPPADCIDVRRLEQEIADVRREIAEMRHAYTESIVQLQADVRQLRQRIEALPPSSPSPESVADVDKRAEARNLIERA